MAAVEAQGLEVRPARVGRSDLLAEFWKQYVALFVALVVWFGSTTGAVLFGWGFEWTWALVWVFLQMGIGIAVCVAVGHLIPTWVLRRVSYLWTAACLVVVAGLVSLVGQTSTFGVPGSLWSVFGLMLLALPVVLLSVGLRALVPALRPSVRLRWHARGDG